MDLGVVFGVDGKERPRCGDVVDLTPARFKVDFFEDALALGVDGMEREALLDSFFTGLFLAVLALGMVDFPVGGLYPELIAAGFRFAGDRLLVVNFEVVLWADGRPLGE